MQKGDHALVAEPTFGEYERSVRLMGGNIHRWRAISHNDFIPSPEKIHKRLRQREMKIVFLCNPNNPTGQVISNDVMSAWADEFPETIFIVDEAYLAFVEGMESTISLKRKNILTLRSMTKDYAIAGLRLGYAVGVPKIIETMKNLRPAWNVNSLAQAAGLAALHSDVYIQETLAKLRNEKDRLVAALEKLDYKPVPSRTNYFLLPVHNGNLFREKLLPHGIIVRDCASFGLPPYIRIATRKSEENTRLLEHLR